MKKLVSVLIALMLCLTAVAAAESIPSKGTGDMTDINTPSKDTGDMTDINTPSKDTGDMTDVGTPSKGDGDMTNISISMITMTIPTDAEHVAVCDKEIKKLQESASVVAYFGEVKNAAGEVVSLTELLGTDTLNVFEFAPLAIENYKEEYGAVTLNIQFPTAYTPGEKVLVMIGLVTAAEDGTQSVQWIVFEGTAMDNGAIEVVLDSATMLSIQNGTAVMAVVSK